MTLQFPFSVPTLRSYRRILSNITWLGSASLLVKPVWFLFITLLCARVLGASGYGVLNTALSLAGLSLAFTDFGVTHFTVREVAADPTRASRLFSNFVLLRIVLLVLAVGIALTTGIMLGYERELFLALCFGCLYQVAMSMTAYGRSFFQAFGVLRYEAVSLVIEKTLVISAGTAFLLATTSPAHTLFGMSIGIVLTMGGTLWWLVRKQVPFRRSELSIPYVTSTLRTLIPFGLASIFGMFFFRVDTVMVEAMLGISAAGQYGLAFRIVEALNVLPFIVVEATVYPRLAETFGLGRLNELRSLVRYSALGLGVVTIFIATALLLFASPLIHWIAVDAQLDAAVPVLTILCWAFPLTSLRFLYYVALLATGQQHFTAVGLGIGVVINVSLNAILIPHYGILGAAIATVSSEIVLLLAYGLRYYQHIHPLDP